MLVAACVGLIALHPINVHMVEWLSNRKHLLVVLLLGWATWKALKQEVEKASPTLRDWAIYFVAYVAAWLCFPTGMLWIFWLLVVFHPELVGHDKSCWNAIEVFRGRVRDVVLKPKQTEWTFNRTLAAFNAGL
jgi:hypothetical protein